MNQFLLRTCLLFLLGLAGAYGCSGNDDAKPVEEPLEEEPLVTFYGADNTLFQYTGRIDFTNKALPRFWAPGVYVNARFEGTECTVSLKDEVLWGTYHNYVTIIIDADQPKRIKLSTKDNQLKFDQLANGEHTITICKGTESAIGYLEFAGLKCKKLLSVGDRPTRRIEFIGNSITCGMGSDDSVLPCGQGEWYDQNNAYSSYGPLCARSLDAEWMLTAVSGIGLMHSCCDHTEVMPDIYDKINLREDKMPYDFSYQPDVVTITLGQNDGVQDSITFVTKYVQFIETVQGKNPGADIVCLTSPMADDYLMTKMKGYITGIVNACQAKGNTKVYKYFYSKRFASGCTTHPNLDEHVVIAGELSEFIKSIKQW